MSEYCVPHLCGGILFNLFLEARKLRSKKRDRMKNGTDNLSNVDVYKGFVFVITGECMKDYGGGSIRKCVSQYRSCENSTGVYVPFTDNGVRSLFLSQMKTDKKSVYNRIIAFKNDYLNESKCEWLVRALIDTIKKDDCIKENQVFDVSKSKCICKSELNDVKEVSFCVFIGSVLNYVIDNYPDCESGRETFLQWYSRNNERSEWKFDNCSIGNDLNQVNVYFENVEAKESSIKNEKSESFINTIISEEILQHEDYDEETNMEAQKFCMKYEKELALLPLCQIAYDVDPLHNDVRKMYTDYKLCNSKVKRRIMELKEIPILDFSDVSWKERCINKYNNQILEDGLSTREFLYEGAKYFHRAYERYSEYEIVNFDPRIFERPFKGGIAEAFLKDNLTYLSYYIIDFYWYKKEHPEHYVEPPMDYLWQLCDLGGCHEAEMTFWICKFIITSSYQMVEDGYPKDERWENVFIKNELIQTQEDLYYYALLQLYWLYMIEREDDLSIN